MRSNELAARLKKINNAAERLSAEMEGLDTLRFDEFDCSLWHRKGKPIIQVWGPDTKIWANQDFAKMVANLEEGFDCREFNRAALMWAKAFEKAAAGLRELRAENIAAEKSKPPTQ